MSNAISKRCPKGYHINEKTGQCEQFNDTPQQKEPKKEDPKQQVGTKGCKEGYHKHPGMRVCHPISQSHRNNKTAEEWHKAHNIKQQRSSRPVNNPPKKEEPKKEIPKKEEPKKETPKKEAKDIRSTEEVHVADEMTDYFCSYYTRDARKKVSKYMDNADKVTKGLEEGYDNPYERAFMNSDVKVGNLWKMKAEMLQSSAKDFSKSIKLNPYGLGTIRKISMGEANSYLMQYSQSKGEIRFANSYNGMGDSNAEGPMNRRDPVTGEITEWGFHFKGSTHSNSITHEYGHACMHVLADLRHYYRADKNMPYDDIMKKRDELREVTSMGRTRIMRWIGDNGYDAYQRIAREHNALSHEYDMECVGTISMCEYLYEKLYDTKVIPSECYSIYGYAGKLSLGTSMPRYQVNSLNASERIAEAYNDVCVRGKDANSMSKLIVSYVNFETERMITHGTTRFEDAIMEYKEKYGVPERIIKML